MPIDIVMPRMGLTMEEGTVTAWLKQPGQTVRAGEPLLEIETDKATVEIEATASGVLAEGLAPVGTTAPVGTVIGQLLSEGERVSQAAPDQATRGQAGERALPAPPTAPAQAGSPPEPHLSRSIPLGWGAAYSPATLSPGEPGSSGTPQALQAPAKVRASPAARHQARQLGQNLAHVKGTGPGGRVVAWNVQDAAAGAAAVSAAQAPEPKASPVAQRLAADLGVDLTQVAGTGPSGRVTRKDVEQAAATPAAAGEAPAAPAAPATQGETLQPLTRVQRLMAERMTASFSTAPHFYEHAEVDARALVALRESLLPRLQERAGVHLTYTDLLVKLCALTLANHPRLMARWTDAGLRQASGVHLGVAVDAPQGLVVPVIRDADRLGLSEIARRRTDLSERARAGKLLPQDMELGVFTLSNLGMYNIDSFEAILNPPQAAILAVGRLKERPLAENGVLIAAPTLKLSLSVDHRVADGVAAARFLSDLVDMLEAPGLALG